MPFTAKLSRKFYDQFGDEIANELVGLLNIVDQTYRTEMRELNELNFARFDAKLEQRLAEQSASLRTGMADQGASLRTEIAELRGGLREEIGRLGERLGTQIAALEARTARDAVTQTRWMVGLWAAQITVFVGTVLVVLRGP